MTLLQIIGLAATALTILGVVIGVAVRLSAFPSERKITTLENENAQLHRKLDELAENQTKLIESLSLLKATASEAQALKAEIDQELNYLAQMTGATSSSILVPYPPSGNTRFAFLSIAGTDASKLKHLLLDINKGIAGQVFAGGQPKISNTPQGDARWNPKIDKQTTFRTDNLLCAPLRYGEKILGVAQFLNKPDGFSEQDKDMLGRATATLAYKVGKFVQRVENFETLALGYSQDAEDGTVIVVDMSASSILLKGAHPVPRTDVVNLINEYLENLTVTAIAHGCIVDKFMWDGCLLSLNVAKPIASHRDVAFRTAVAMIQEFSKLKDSWLRGDYPVERLFCRVAIASGSVIQVDMGPAQYRQKTIVGDPVVAASALCANGPRDRNVIIVDQSVYDALLPHNLKSVKVPEREMGKACGLIAGAYRIEPTDKAIELG